MVSSENLGVKEHCGPGRLDRGESAKVNRVTHLSLPAGESSKCWNVGGRVGKKGVLVVVCELFSATLPPPSVQHTEDEVVPRGRPL